MTTAIDYTCAPTVRCGVFPHDRMAMAGTIYAISAHVEVNKHFMSQMKAELDEHEARRSSMSPTCFMRSLMLASRQPMYSFEDEKG